MLPVYADRLEPKTFSKFTKKFTIDKTKEDGIKEDIINI